MLKVPGIYGSQSRDDFDKDDVEQVLSSCLIKKLMCIYKMYIMLLVFFFCLRYFGYMGMLAVEGTYSKMEGTA